MSQTRGFGFVVHHVVASPACPASRGWHLPLQPFCNPNPRSAIAFVGTRWETSLGVSLQMATVVVTVRE